MRNIFTLYFLFLLPFVNAQNNSVTSGATAIGTSGTVTYSIGQIDYKTNTGANGTITQGVQQPFEISTLSNSEIPQIQLAATVFPNPTVQNVTLSIKEYDLTHLKYQLFDVQGRSISHGKIIENQTQIEMSWLAAAHYFLKITDNQKELKTFKIIKN